MSKSENCPGAHEVSVQQLRRNTRCTLYYTVLCSTISYYTILYHSILYHSILYYYSTLLYPTLLQVGAAPRWEFPTPKFVAEETSRAFWGWLVLLGRHSNCILVCQGGAYRDLQLQDEEDERTLSSQKATSKPGAIQRQSGVGQRCSGSAAASSATRNYHLSLCPWEHCVPL